MNIFQDLQTELEFFVNDLNWTYIIIYAFILHGIKYKQEFEWFNQLFENSKLKSFKFWLSGIIVMTIFIIFKYFEGELTVSYVSSILRSWIIVIVFNSFLSDKIKIIEKSKDK
jgi:hypothetical protein